MPHRASHSGGFTLLEALLVIVLVVVLVALLMPGLRQARQQAHLTVCASNLRQIVTGVNLYASEHRGHVPHGLHNTTYGISSETFSYSFGLLHRRYLPVSPTSRSGLWICPAETSPPWLDSTPWAWTSAQDRPRWRGTYWQAFRARHPTIPERIVNPANHFGSAILPNYKQVPLATGGSSWAWPPLRPNDHRGSFVYLFDGIVSYEGSIPKAGRTTRHPAGYQAAYYDGSAQLFAGEAADKIDTYSVLASTYYNASYYAAAKSFDPARGLTY